ncbi:hypothetical protein [Cerasicoccus frondis]|uniref:hypothetical protein n=1 Tax=Cerasicoccus frondis TaxID=490090 RepID=UPI0028529C5F|nr:hypothetical protein [Cerasicoccus frondis]
MENKEVYDEFMVLTECRHFVVYRKDTSALLMLPYKQDHRGFSRFLKNFKKLVLRIPEENAQDGDISSMILTWGDAYYISRYLTSTLSVIAVFPKNTNLGLILNRLEKITETVITDFDE